MNRVHLIMPMGGEGSRFSGRGFDMPKPLIEIQGKPFFYWATQSIRKFVDLASLTFVILQQHVDEYHMNQVVLQYFPEAKIVIIPAVLNGAVLTCLEGVKSIDDMQPIVFNDCDHIFDCPDFYNFCETGDFVDLDGALLTFTSNDPKFSFAAFDVQGNITHTVEKRAISHDAICGAYYFRNKEVFQEACEEYLKVCNYKEFFVSGVYNVMADHKAHIRAFRVKMHLPFGTPEEYDVAKLSDDFEALCR